MQCRWVHRRGPWGQVAHEILGDHAVPQRGGRVDATVRSVTSQHLAPGDTLQYLLVDGASSDRTVERALAAAAGSAVNQGAVDVEVVSEPDTGMYDAR
jgi:hypothetical protein